MKAVVFLVSRVLTAFSYIAAILVVVVVGIAAYPGGFDAAMARLPGAVDAVTEYVEYAQQFLAHAPLHHDVRYYLAHPKERAEKIAAGMEKLVDDPGTAATENDPNFVNANAADLIARMREYQSK
jgi:hypothetical protein